MPETEKPDKTPETPAPESGETTRDGSPATATTEPETSETKPGTDYSGVIGGGFIWLIILGVVAYWVFPHNRAQVFLEASRERPGRLNGIVLFKGAPVSNGTVYLVLEDPKKQRYLSSTILPVIEDGKFVTSGNESLVFWDSNKKPRPLRITATFSGQQQGEKKDKAPIAVKGKATLYLNYPAPAKQWLITVTAIVAVLLTSIVLDMFTGELTRSRARWLFAITYIVSFMSLAVPIWAIVAVSKSEHLVGMMEEAPIGLIKGTARGVQNPQWLLNVGGAVEPAKEMPTQEEKGPLPAQEVPTKEPEIGRSSPVETPSPTLPSSAVQQSPTSQAPSPTLPSPTPQQSPTPQENIGPDELRQVPGFAMVRGGLAVPFYVIILAMLGAGINMTKKIPGIQKDYTKLPPGATEDMAGKALAAPMKILAMLLPRKTLAAPVTATKPPDETPFEEKEKQRDAVSAIRKSLIDNYMGLISAPFLAIAVYYLLQVVATNIAEPVLVLVSFATGFISDSIVAAITTLAKKMLEQASGEPSGEKPHEPKVPDATSLPEVPYALSASSDPKELEKAEDLQRRLNMFPSVSLKVDGVPGPRTSAAYKTVTGKYLSGDPRGE
jgi:hypothetical protein